MVYELYFGICATLLWPTKEEGCKKRRGFVKEEKKMLYFVICIYL